MHAKTPPGPRERRTRAQQIRPSTFLRYGVATLAIALVVLLKQLLDPLIAQQAPFLLLSAAVLVAAWFGGLGPGLLATVLGAVAADYLFLPPVGSFTPLNAAFLPLLLFLLQGALISVLVEALRSARRRAEARTLEAQRRQEDLRQSEERFRLLVEGVRDYAIFVLDSEGRVATWNEGAERTMGYEAQEITGEHLSVFYTEEDVERGHPERDLRVAATEGRYEEEGLRVCKGGSRLWAHVVITALRDEDGSLRGFSKVTRDITERKSAEEALKASETKYRTLVEQIPAITYVQEPLESSNPKAITYVSPQYQAILGYPPDSQIIDEEHWLRTIHPEDRERVLAEEVRTDESGEPFKVEYRVVARDGRVVWVRDEAALVRGEEGEPLYWLGVQYDITEQKRETQERERIEQELRIARLIQQTLLPKTLPELSGYEVAAYYQPADEVGGDFYDFFELEDGRLGLVVGDATGHGMPAAVLMASTRSVLRAVAQRGGGAPGQVLAEANEVLFHDIPPNMFVTCFYAILDPTEGRLRYANAGHNLPCCRHEGPATELKARGMPLGLMPGMRYEEKEAVLAPGESVLFYSDGLVEAHNPQGEMFGTRCLRSFLTEHPTGGTDLITVLMEEMKRFTGTRWEQEDDITLVTLQRLDGG
ncbi:MAG: SpoIIE family protein phosphatase [Actinomycetota bacterium]|nr:SpoIIE family protein phosphatase [Actinomycetota bacterium]